MRRNGSRLEGFCGANTEKHWYIDKKVIWGKKLPCLQGKGWRVYSELVAIQ